MRAFRLLATSLVAALSIWLGSCSNKSQNSDSIVGIWKEYRADANDDYGLSSWKFNSDGSGLFIEQASEMWDIMEELGIAVDKSFFEPCDLTPPTLEELCRMFGVNSLEELRNMPPSPMAF